MGYITKLTDQINKEENNKNLEIKPIEAKEYRKFLRQYLKEKTNIESMSRASPDNNKKKGTPDRRRTKKIHRNYMYFEKLKERIQNYPKIDIITEEANRKSEELYTMPK